MPLKLIDPQKARSPNFRIRGTYLGFYIDRTAGTPVKAIAQKLLQTIKHDIERGAITKKGEPTFADAATAYLNAGGETRFLAKLVKYFGDTPLRLIDQMAIDTAAGVLYPSASPATKNRQVYTIVLTILSRAGVATKFQRPIGGAGLARVIYLEPKEAWRLLDTAEQTDVEIAVIMAFCLYTGARLSEALALKCRNVNLSAGTALCEHTKNGDPRTVYLPAPLIAALANLPDGLNRDGHVFSWAKYLGTSKARFYRLVDRVYETAGVDPQGAPIHILRHTYATWMRRFAAADGRALMDTGAWRDMKSTQRYMHTKVDESAHLVDHFPARAKSA